MNLKRMTAIVALVGVTLTAGACSSDTKDSSSSKDKQNEVVVKEAKDSTALLSKAAGHMSGTAGILSGAFSAQFPEKFAGDTTSKASELRSGLTFLLQEHVYLAGIATQAAVDGADNKNEVAALDANSVKLSEAISSVYNEEAGDQFLELWRKHIGFFVDYTTGKATGDDAKTAKALADLTGYGSDFGAFIESATEGAVPKSAIEENLGMHVVTLTGAIDAQVAGDADAVSKLRVAAGHMSGTAKVLAGAFAAQFPDKFPGDTADGASELRAGLTALLQEHVYLAGITTDTALAGKEFDNQAAALDENSVALSEAVASVYGADAGTQFLELWRKHIGFFVDYTTGKATGDDDAVKTALSDLEGYGGDFGAFLESATNDGLPKDAVAENLAMHVETLTAAIDAQAKEAK